MNEINIEAKGALLQKANKLLQSQVDILVRQLAELKEAETKESKSSAGDKYETQREMIKQSRDMLDNQLARVKKMLHQLQTIPSKTQETVVEGTLMKLSIGCIWVSVPLGTLIYKGYEYQLVSTGSPLFLALKNLKTDESILFRGKNIKIEKLV